MAKPRQCSGEKAPGNGRPHTEAGHKGSLEIRQNGHIAAALLSLAVPIGSVSPDPRNVRLHPEPNLEAIKRSLEAYGQRKPIVVNQRTGHIEAGNGLWAAAKALGWTEIAAVMVEDDDVTAKGFGIMDNRSAELAEWDMAGLKDLLQELDTGAFDMDLTGFDERALEELMTQVYEPPIPDKEQARLTLAARFIIPPFSVLDARQGYWQERKRAWLALGIQSELGRAMIDPTLNHYRKQEKYGGRGLARTFGQDLMKGENPNFGNGEASKAFKSQGRQSALQKTGTSRLTWVAGDRPLEQLDEVSRKILAAQPQSGTSIFDPVLCEIAYRWFCPPHGHVLDPFAGGSVRGIVASYLGYSYTGVDLRPEQVAANQSQAAVIVPDKPVKWFIGDSQRVKELAPGEYDLLFSCPPYYDLEVYSDRPGELSAMSAEGFKAAYGQIIADSCAMLKDNRFAVWVVGDVRDRQGIYRNFVADTIAAFQAAGLRLYNEVVLVTSVGSLPIRVIRQFESGRKLGKTHQNVLVFVKGDPRKAVAACGPVKVEWEPEDNGDSVAEEPPRLD